MYNVWKTWKTAPLVETENGRMENSENAGAGVVVGSAAPGRYAWFPASSMTST